MPLLTQDIDDGGERKSSDHGNGKVRPRIVRIGTHKDNNFRSRISEHFLLNESAMNFTDRHQKPSDRSIFRKTIGRALLNKRGDTDYLEVWKIDFTSTTKKINYSPLRNIEKQRSIESEITQLLRENFYFRFIPLKGQEKRIGKTGIESRLIGTVAQCNICRPSENWLGRYSPKRQITNGK
jgi:hypothetical protein